LASSLAASARERRTIARDLHDGVVQDLSGAGYALGSLQKRVPADAAPAFSETLEKVSNAVRDAVTSVRTLIIDIYPRDLTAEGLGVALEDLAGPLRAAGTQVDVTIDLPVEPSPEVAASLYRCAREGLVNVAKHAGAEHVTLELSERDGMALLSIVDDGRGLPAAGIDRRHEGHLGLQLLRDIAIDLGGEFTVVSGHSKGAVLNMALPLRGIGHM
jgi:signal transduction histidine kinase